MSSVLYDVPGPRARVRNRVLGAATILVVLALLGITVWRLAATGQFEAQKWAIFTYSRPWLLLLEGLGATLSAFIVAAIGALALGFILAVGRLSDHAWVRGPVGWIVEILRAIPVLIFMMLLYYGLPIVGVRMDPYWAVVIALIAYNGSVLAEALRAGVESLPRGQGEAGYAIGLRKNAVMRLILMPQAVRAMMPVIISQLVVALKDTALGFIITYPELLHFIQLLGNQVPFGSPLVPTAIVGGTIYVVLCLILSYVAYRVQRSTSRSPKVRTTGRGGGGAGATATATESIALRGGAAGPLEGTSR
jgi:glutamate transport system permease protein